jgi:predicted outer membrane repeat protein
LVLPATAAVHYVNLDNPTPAAPYTNWASAAVTIQEAIDAADVGDVVLVTNGVYQTGGRPFNGVLTNRVAVTKALELRSVNGPAVTRIRGYQAPRVILARDAIRCVALADGAVLSGFTLSDGATLSMWGSPPARETEGGGVRCETDNVVVSNCVFTANWAGHGGGAAWGTYFNCVFTGNAVTGWAGGGGAARATLNNCTLTRNSAPFGGGAEACTLNNCILYYNQAVETDPNYSWGTLNYCCTTPLPASGSGNIEAEPLLASASHLSSGSPCRGVGSATFAAGADVDGEAWLTPPSIGCDEYHSGAVTGPLNVSILANYTNVPTGYEIRFVSEVEGRCSDSRWELDGGVVISNRLEVFRSWTNPGDYAVTLRVYSESYPAGVTATQVVHVLSNPVQYVAAGNLNPVPPYTSWATAATNIQDALDEAFITGTVLVSNGVYQTGGRAVFGALTNRAAVTKPLTLRSVNGPAVTTIQGYQVPGATNGNAAVRCVFLTNGVTLAGFTLSGGATLLLGNADYELSGGGVWCESASAVVSNCIFSGNSAANGGGGVCAGTLLNCFFTGNTAVSGGGAIGATLTNCALIGNTATGNGGGAAASSLTHCTLTGNAALNGGAAESSTLNNCITWFNEAVSSAKNCAGCNLNYCCTPDAGNNNLAAEPQLTDPVHLSASSPCRGAGNPEFAVGVDIDGEPWAAPPTIGCDEFYAAPITGSLGVVIVTGYGTVAAGFPLNLTSRITGHASLSVWSFGDGTFATNQPYTTKSWTSPGNYQVVLRAYNASYPSGIAATGSVQVVGRPVHYVDAAGTNPVPPYASWATAATVLQDAVDAVTTPGALVLVANGIYDLGGRVVFGALTNRVAITSPLTVQSVNGPAFTTIRGSGPVGDVAVRGIYLTNGAALCGFTVTQGATRGVGDNERERSGGGIWCPSTSALVSNCVVIANEATDRGGGIYAGTVVDCLLQSNSTTSDWYGGGGVSQADVNRCHFLSNLATSGGGAEGGIIRNSTFSNNTAIVFGGGANDALLYNCLFRANRAGWGGGANGGVINNCTLLYNYADWVGGGGDNATLNNCISLYNYAGRGSHNYGNQILNYCLTTPAYGTSIDGDPQFVNPAAGDYRLQPTSPAINSGWNGAVGTGLDLGNNPRIAGGTVDMGAYELQAPTSLISYDWLQKYGLPLDGSADLLDPDGDKFNNWQEWIAGTIPTNQLSYLRMLSPTGSVSEVTLRWESVAARSYFLQRATTVSAASSYATIASNLVGQAGITVFADTNSPPGGAAFYRVGVQR